jgi:hypothetical protein
MRAALLFGFMATVCSVAVPAEPRPVPGIELSADVPTVAVTPRRAGRFAIHLPSLTYSLTLTAYCKENWQPASVSISIADSRKSLDAEQLERATVLDLELQVPSNQIAPVRIERFCIKDDQNDFQPDAPGDNKEPAGADENTIIISAALSAQASLLCATDSEQSITYITKPLDVMLECGVPEPAAKPAENQEFAR